MNLQATSLIDARHNCSLDEPLVVQNTRHQGNVKEVVPLSKIGPGKFVYFGFELCFESREYDLV